MLARLLSYFFLNIILNSKMQKPAWVRTLGMLEIGKLLKFVHHLSIPKESISETVYVSILQ
jgi:hypothetical protein